MHRRANLHLNEAYSIKPVSLLCIEPTLSILNTFSVQYGGVLPQRSCLFSKQTAGSMPKQKCKMQQNMSGEYDGLSHAMSMIHVRVTSLSLHVLAMLVTK